MSIQYTTDQLQRKFPAAPGSPGFARLAESFRSEGRLDEAIQICQDGLKARPFQLSGYLVLGKALIDAGRLEEAREQFESALRLDPRCLSAMHFLAQIMNKLQWGEAAAGYYRSILEVEPWDADIRALLGQPPLQARTQAALPSTPEAHEPAPAQDYTPVDPNEDTFQKPEGFAGDVMEINLNDGADDLSLEDALAMQPASEAPAAPEMLMEPVPPSTVPVSAAPAVFPESAPAASEPMADEAAPISGQDVEDRLDSLFGADDAMPKTGIASLPVVPDPVFDPDATMLEAPSRPMAPGLPEPGETDMVEVEDPDRVSGSDIEKRLDDLFSLTEEDKFPGSHPAETNAFASPGTASMPAAQAAVDFGMSDFGTRESETDALTEAGGTTGVEMPGESRLETDASLVTEPVPEVSEGMVTGQDVAEQLDHLFGADPVTEERAAEKPDTSDKADAAWSPAALAPSPSSSPEETGEMSSVKEPEPQIPENSMEPQAAKAEAWDLDLESAQPPVGDVMSTESMLPMGWLADAGEQPRITGADIEAQLDKLFDMEGESDRFDAAKVVPGNLQAPVTFADLDPSRPSDAAEAKSQALPGDESDRTVTMPAMKDSGLKESVSDWLARQTDQGAGTDESGELRLTSGRDTMFMPPEESPAPSESGRLSDSDLVPDFDATLELPATRLAVDEESEAFGTMASEDMGALSETTSIEMIDGTDVAERLDELFAPEGSGIETTGMEMPPMEPEALADGALETSDSEAMVTGEEVASRLSEIFEVPATSAEVPLDLETGLETKETAEQPSTVAPQASNPLAPMMDEEDGYPEEEEMPPQNGAAANVATVTLAEIYFQQGLKEQALQIYRQLLEREPGNDSVSKRITEIEASKSEGENRDTDGQKPDSDPRRPRPGLKVPKRKK